MDEQLLNALMGKILCAMGSDIKDLNTFKQKIIILFKAYKDVLAETTILEKSEASKEDGFHQATIAAAISSSLEITKQTHSKSLQDSMIELLKDVTESMKTDKVVKPTIN